MANLVVELVGRGSATLSEACHVATGGEASVYGLGDVIVKVYLDDAKMARDGMVEKVAALRPFKTSRIVAPEGIVLAKKTSRPVGFYMGRAVGEPMPRVFTTSFWRRASFTVASANKVVEAMREVMSFAHAGGAIMVDANELNWIVSVGADPEPRVVDVDSWAVGRWPARVVMRSIRDWHTTGVNESSDRFAWAVVTFQLYAGIHPYKGTLAGYRQDEWGKRMQANASVFTKGVKLNDAVRDFGEIPSSLLDWYEAVFQHGERSAPPSPLAPVGRVPAAAVVRHAASSGGSGALVFDKIFDVYPVVRTWPCGAVLARAPGGLQVWEAGRRRKLYDASVSSTSCEVVKVAGGYVVGEVDAGIPRFYHVDDAGGAAVQMDLRISGHELFRGEDRLFLATSAALLELGYVELLRPTLSVKSRISILHPQAVRWFEGVGVEKAFEATFLILPFRDKACATVRVPELDGLEVVSARAGARFAALVCEDRSGDLVKVELAFDADYATYKVWKACTDSPDLNLAVLPRGVCATIVRDGELVVFVPSSGVVKKVADGRVSTRMVLGNFGDVVVCVDGGTLWSLRTA